MQRIAMENNPIEIAFCAKCGSQYEIRWFTPTVEDVLGGHAAIHFAYVLFNYENYTGERIDFIRPRGGPLTVTKQNELKLNFLTDIYEKVALTRMLTDGLYINTTEILKQRLLYPCF